METRWLYVTSENFANLRDASKKTCIIPMGCVEKHGLTLPLGTDILKASDLAFRASQLEAVTIFPDFTFGDICAGEHLKKPDGTISFGVEFEMKMLEAMCDQIAENGFEKILVLNGHGGNNNWLATFARNVGSRPHKFVFAYTNTPKVIPHKMAEMILSEGSGIIPELTKEDEAYILKCHDEKMVIGHACIHEAASMMAFAPETVHLDRLGIESGKSLNKEMVKKFKDADINLASGGWGFNYPNWYCGDDYEGLNERMASAAYRLQIERLAEIFKVFKDDEEIVPMTKRRWKDGLWE